MKYLGFILLTLLISCTNRTKSNKTISESEEIDSLTHEYLRPDTDFNDFILQFGFNPDFQKLRIKFPLSYSSLESNIEIPSNNWHHEKLYVELEAITDVSNGSKPNEKSNERVFSWVNTNSHISKNYYFRKEKGLWYLVKIDLKAYSQSNDNEDFFKYLGSFCKDSVFQKQRISFPLNMTTLDGDFNEIHEEITQEKWRFTRFYYNCDSISVFYYDFNRDFKDTDERRLFIHGVENGINALFTFKRINKIWMMIKYEDYST
jgi:hypothetical protein